MNGVMDGKHYNRVVRFHKLMFEACMRLIWSGFIPWIQAHHEPRRATLDKLSTSITDLGKDGLEPQSFDSILNGEDLANIDALLQQYMVILRTKNGGMSKFWITYIDLVTILLNMIRA